MSFYGKDPEPPTEPGMKQFMYTMNGNDHADAINAQHVFFYESGHVGFWNDAEGDDRTLILAVRNVDAVWEETE